MCIRDSPQGFYEPLGEVVQSNHSPVTWQHSSTIKFYMFADFAGMPKELLLEAVKILEQQRKAKLFKGSSADDIGIKFFA